MFAIPEHHISISSPCQVSCAPLNDSIGYQVTNDSSVAQPGESFCNVGDFDDTTINRCAVCYGFIPQQLFLANCTCPSLIPQPKLLTPYSLASAPHLLSSTTRRWQSFLSGWSVDIQ